MVRPQISMKVALLVGALMGCAACGEARETQVPRFSLPRTPLPGDAIVVAAGSDLQAVIDGADSGARLVLEPGRYDGPVLINKPLSLHGPQTARIISKGHDSTVRVQADDVALVGFTVEGSGSRFERLDAGVRVKGHDLVIADLLVQRALFGILVEDSKRVSIYGNVVKGMGEEAMGLRGDGIRIWGVEDSVIHHNRVEESRDVVVWFSTGNEIHHNTVTRGRYGTHFMYGHRNTVHHNCYVDNTVGIFVMYTHDITLHHNLMAGSAGSAGMGLGVKESGNLIVKENVFIQNTKGIYLDTSPHQHEHTNKILGNVVRLNGIAVAFHGRAARNTFGDNAFKDNGVLVQLGGRGDAMDSTWSGNTFDDYQGYDLDGDGVGDIHYEVRKFTSEVTSKHPDLHFFHGSLSLAMIDLAGHVVPLFQPILLMQDENPRVQPSASSLNAMEWIHARAAQ